MSDAMSVAILASATSFLTVAATLTSSLLREREKHANELRMDQERHKAEERASLASTRRDLYPRFVARTHAAEFAAAEFAALEGQAGQGKRAEWNAIMREVLDLYGAIVIFSSPAVREEARKYCDSLSRIEQLDFHNVHGCSTEFALAASGAGNGRAHAGRSAAGERHELASLGEGRPDA